MHANTPADPLTPLAGLPGVPDTVASVRTAVDRLYGHRVMRRRATEVAGEAALRGARGSAALSGADWALEEVRRRTDFGDGDQARTIGAALRVTAEAGGSLQVWRATPLRVLARLHLLAASREVPDGAPEETIGRPRLAGETVDEPALAEDQIPLPGAEELAARLDALNQLLVAGSAAPALVTAAVVHGELLTLRPFTTHNGLVARAAQRIVLLGSGLDPKGVAPAEAGHAETGTEAYAQALAGYASGTAQGMAEWIAHCGRAVELGVRESVAVCEALQRGAA
ncbi:MULTISPECIES: Fic family protein [unclassified Streptomyces]|uniref:Fic family protein n=1 Tax=Streptomyces TaxID=1883 RepID=UPI0019049DE3|nr:MULTISPECIES: Fic family protein [unclassified Streptomyces]MCU4748062.1 Fic family protein [Streptomyces sp. G-5]QQN78665.1 oxidoreductase [Streptomyces sp. XC 2026]